MLHKSKLMLPILAVIVGVAASAFTTVNSMTQDDGTWYSYETSAPQSPPARMTATNYVRSSEPPCHSTVNECAVELNQDFGTTPDFSNVSFDANGFPIAGTGDVIANKKKN